MRVAVVATWYPSAEHPVLGVFVREHARALARRHDVTVIAADPAPAPGRAPFRLVERDEDGLRTIRVVYRRAWTARARIEGLLFALGVQAAVWRLARRGERPDVLHAHVYAAGLMAIPAGRLAGAPVVVTEHLTSFRDGGVKGFDRIVAKLAFAGADLVSPVSEELAGHLTRGGFRFRRMEVVPNVVDTSRFHPGERHDAGLRLLTVGRPSAHKGTDVLLDAMAVLHAARTGVTLDIVGDSPDRPAYEAQARELGIADVVRFRGDQEPEQVAAAMREADLFLLPSRTENLPCVTIEAAASGLRVVAADVGGMSEVVSRDIGVLVPPEDPGALATATLEALERGDYDAQAAAASARERFGAEAVARRWTDLYRSLPRRRRRRRSPSRSR